MSIIMLLLSYAFKEMIVQIISNIWSQIYLPEFCAELKKFELYHLISLISIFNISWGKVGYRDNLLLDSCHNILLFINFLNYVFLSRQWLMIFYTLLMMCTSKFLWLLNVTKRFSSVNNCKANCVFPHFKRQLIHFSFHN